jgi:Type I phosphodiesterase / nucleotide pyrophosphatase
MQRIYPFSIFEKPITMKIAVCTLLLLSAGRCLAQADSSTENIFIITTDGFRWQEVFNGADSTLIGNAKYVRDPSLLKQLYWDSTAILRREKLMPFLWNTIAKQGRIYGNRLYQNYSNVSNMYKISYPGYNEMLTGYPDPLFIPNVPLRNRNRNILEYLNEETQYKGKVAAFSSWNIFSAILNKKRSGLPGSLGYERLLNDSNVNTDMINEMQDNEQEKKHTRYDLFTYLSAREYIETKHPKVVLIGFGETDEFAHSGRYDLYLQQATNIDKMISDLWYLVQTMPCYRNKTTFLITTDHGRGRSPDTWFKHGILTKGSGETWFAIIGPGISGGGEMTNKSQFYQKQMASTIAQILGKEFETGDSQANTIPVSATVKYNMAFAKETK